MKPKGQINKRTSKLIISETGKAAEVMTVPLNYGIHQLYTGSIFHSSFYISILTNLQSSIKKRDSYSDVQVSMSHILHSNTSVDSQVPIHTPE